VPRIKLQEQPFYEFYYEVTVQVRDINYGGHLGNDALVGLIHEARFNLLHRLGLSEKNLGDGQTGIIMADLAVNFKGEGFLLDTLCIESHIGEMSEMTLRGFRVFHRVSKDDLLLALAETGIVAFNYRDRKVASIPDAFLQALDEYQLATKTYSLG
jgi:acyl-CoA thioesterase FadM